MFRNTAQNSAAADPDGTLDDSGSPVPADPRFDHDRVAMLRALHIEGEPDIFALTGQIFLETAPDDLAMLLQSVANRDASAAARAAHSLKGSAASLGAAGLARACAELEAATKLGRTAAEDEALARVEAELRLAQEWLVEEIG